MRIRFFILSAPLVLVPIVVGCGMLFPVTPEPAADPWVEARVTAQYAEDHCGNEPGVPEAIKRAREAADKSEDLTRQANLLVKPNADIKAVFTEAQKKYDDAVQLRKNSGRYT